jgi:hypothetical protein
MGGACSMDGRYEKCLQVLVGKPEGKRLFGRPRSKSEDTYMNGY